MALCPWCAPCRVIPPQVLGKFKLFSVWIGECWFCILEPQTHMRPKIKDKELGQAWKFADSSKTVPLVCAVQGYPAPAFRYPFETHSHRLNFPKSPKRAFPRKWRTRSWVRSKNKSSSTAPCPWFAQFRAILRQCSGINYYRVNFRALHKRSTQIKGWAIYWDQSRRPRWLQAYDDLHGSGFSRSTFQVGWLCN